MKTSNLHFALQALACSCLTAVFVLQRLWIGAVICFFGTVVLAWKGLDDEE